MWYWIRNQCSVHYKGLKAMIPSMVSEGWECRHSLDGCLRFKLSYAAVLELLAEAVDSSEGLTAQPVPCQAADAPGGEDGAVARRRGFAPRLAPASPALRLLKIRPGPAAVPQTSPRLCPRRSGNRSPTLFKVLPKQAPRSEAARPRPSCSCLLAPHAYPDWRDCAVGRTPARGPGRRPVVKYRGRRATGRRRVLSDSAGWRAGHLAPAVRGPRWPKELAPRSKAPAHLPKALVLGEERSSSGMPASDTFTHVCSARRLAERRRPREEKDNLNEISFYKEND
ncbi:uncharacterized protein [Chlorocebus sabaeus]|uniref:uncharacterized protein n=1 Tax=Chlorocebus sabaeus TaxID=60711 RepID=UPI003BF9B832